MVYFSEETFFEWFVFAMMKCLAKLKTEIIQFRYIIKGRVDMVEFHHNWRGKEEVSLRRWNYIVGKSIMKFNIS